MIVTTEICGRGMAVAALSEDCRPLWPKLPRLLLVLYYLGEEAALPVPLESSDLGFDLAAEVPLSCMP